MAEAVEVVITVTDEEVNKALSNMEKQFDRVERKGKQAMGGIEKSTNRARDATSLFSNVLGVHIPRQLEKVIGQTKLIGPAFAAAFNISVFLAVGAALLALLPKIREVADEIGGFTKEMKELEEQAVKTNRELLSGFDVKAVGERNLGVINRQIAEIERQRRARVRDSAFGPDTGKTIEVDLPGHKEKELITLYNLRIEVLKRLTEVNKKTTEERTQDEKRAAEEIKQALEQLQNVRQRAAASGYEGEEAVRERLKAQKAELHDLAKDRKQLGASVTAAEIALEQAAAREISNIRRDAAKRRAAEQEKEFNEYVEKQKQLKDIMADAESELGALRAELNGQSVDAMLIQEQRRVTETIARAQELGATETELTRLREDLADQLAMRRAIAEREINHRVLEEHQQTVQTLAGQFESVFDDITSGNIGKRIIGNFKKLFFTILAQWFATTRGMGSVAGGIGGGGGGGGFLGALGSIFFGGGGGIPGGAAGGKGTPPIIGNSFLPGGSAYSVGAGRGGSSLADFLPGVISGGKISFPGSPSITGSSRGGGGSDSGGVTPGGIGKARGMGGVITGGGTLAGKFGALGALGSVLLGGKFGGTLGAIGAGVGSLALLASLNQGALGLSAANTLTGLGIAPALAGPIAGGLIGFGVGSKYGKVAGGITGGISGAIIGGLAFGPVGAIVGAIVGLLGGIFGGIFGGGKRKKQANKLVDAEVIPQVNKIIAEYKGFQLDYASALTALGQLSSESEAALRKLKGEGKSIFQKRVVPAISNAKAEIDKIEAERQRRAGLNFAPPQFHTGGFVGAERLRPGEVMAKLKVGEFIVNDKATAKNRGALEAINSGTEAGAGMNITIQTLDTETMKRWLRDGGARMLRNAIAYDARYGG